MSNKLNSKFGRMVLLIIGFGIMIFTFFIILEWNNLPIQFYFLGKDYSTIFWAILLIIFSIIGTSMIKTGLTGKWDIDV